MSDVRKLAKEEIEKAKTAIKADHDRGADLASEIWRMSEKRYTKEQVAIAISLIGGYMREFNPSEYAYGLMVSAQSIEKANAAMRGVKVT